MKYVELREYLTRTEAELVLDLLKKSGFNALLQSDDLAGLNPSLGFVNGYQLMVDEDDLQEIEAFLSSTDKDL